MFKPVTSTGTLADVEEADSGVTVAGRRHGTRVIVEASDPTHPVATDETNCMIDYEAEGLR